MGFNDTLRGMTQSFAARQLEMLSDYLERKCLEAMVAGKDLAVGPIGPPRIGCDPAGKIDSPLTNVVVSWSPPETRMIEPSDAQVGDVVPGAIPNGQVYHTAKQSGVLREYLIKAGWTPPDGPSGAPDRVEREFILLGRKASDIALVIQGSKKLEQMLGIGFGGSILDGLLAWLKEQAE